MLQMYSKDEEKQINIFQTISKYNKSKQEKANEKKLFE